MENTKLRKVLLEAKKDNKSKNKMLKKLHSLDLEIEDFVSKVEDEIEKIDDNPVYVRKCQQLLANFSKEYSEFMLALRAIVNALDRKGTRIPKFQKTQSKVRDVMASIGNQSEPEQEESGEEETE